MLVEELAELLNKEMRQNQRLTGWRFALHDSNGVEIGLKNNRLGGPYSAPSYKKSISGEVYLIWEDQYFTVAQINSQVVNNFAEYFQLWQATAYYDADGVGLYPVTAIPAVALFDEKAAQVVEHDLQAAFAILDYGLTDLREKGITQIDGRIRVFNDHYSIIDSQGFFCQGRQTPVSFYFLGDHLYGEDYSEKAWPTTQEVKKVVTNTGKITQKLQQKVAQEYSGPIDLLFPPEEFESFLNTFLIRNLSGRLVVNRQSCFTAADFQEQRQVLRRDLTLEINTLLPLRSFSYQATSEGVPAGAVKLIEAGSLQTPLLNYKYARQMQLAPTPLAGGGKGFFLKQQNPTASFQDLVKNTRWGLIVYSVLGMHTQDASSGSFSLTADQCLLVKDGAILGKVKAVINGDFLQSLTSETSQFGLVPGADNPGYKMAAAATLEGEK